MRAARLVLEAGPKPLADVARFRDDVLGRSYPQPARLPSRMRRNLVVREERVPGGRCIVLAPSAGAQQQHILYLHGGGYVNALIRPHWSIIAALIRATGATVTVPIYPLAPENDHRAAWPFLIETYGRILGTAAPANIILAGDSAGGGLALGMVLALREAGLPEPGRIVLFSPWLDLTLADAAARRVEPHDPMLRVDALRLCGRWWAGGDDPRSPRLSPLYADLRGFPPIDLYQGTADLFVVDARSFAARARSAGALGQYAEYSGAFHVFVGATFTPEAQDVFHRIAISLASSDRPARRD